MSAKPTLFVDAKNALYRAIFATRNDRRNLPKYHYFVIFLRQLSSWIRKYDPSSVHIFWDAPRKDVWRRKILPTYKDRENNQYIEDISDELASTTVIAKAMLDKMNIRQYYKDRMEADDLIYSAVLATHPKPSVIVSTDSDMIQIPYRFSSCSVYHPQKQEVVELPKVDPVMQKALVGDKSDAIPGYYGIGPKKSEKILVDYTELETFLKDKGRRTFGLNMILIDLSLCPYLLENRLYVNKIMSREVEFSQMEINSMSKKYKVNGLMQEQSNIIPGFKKLA